MTTKEKISLAIREPRQIGRSFMLHTAKYWHNDTLYLKLLFYFTMGKRLDLKHPKTFNEKLQWLKLYNRRPEYTTMVDKYAVKEYVASKIGKEYVIPTLGVWDKPEQIEWDKLPNRFVLKTTHGGGNTGVVICKDKSTFNREQAITKLNRSLQSDIYVNLREWPYKNVPKRIIAAEYLEDESKELRDYKFCCFSGKVRFFKVDFGRQEGEHHANYYSADGQLLDFGEAAYPPVKDKYIPMPTNLNKMISLAETLAGDICFLRVDFYNICGAIKFGELTFFPAGGMGLFTDSQWDEKIGNWLTLPAKCP